MPFVPTIRTTYDRHHHQPPIMLVTLRPVREWILVCFSPPIPRNLPRFFPFFSFLLPFFLSFLLFLPSPPPSTRILLSFHRTAYTFLCATLTIPVFTTMRRSFPTREGRKKDFLEGRKEREKKRFPFLSFLSFLSLLPSLVSSLEEYYYHKFYRLANDRRRERLRRR